MFSYHDLNSNSPINVSALAETTLWTLQMGWLCAVGAKANVLFAVRHKIELKKNVRWGK
ncbi:MAG: hypothetical protein ACK4LB_07740 [Spirosomataceae bacterium]